MLALVCISLFLLCAGDSQPVKVFDRTANLANNQIINYKCDPAEKWLVLIGIAPGAPEVTGLRMKYYHCLLFYIMFHAYLFLLFKCS